VLIAAVVLMVFFFSWQESRTRDANLSAAMPTQTPSGTDAVTERNAQGNPITPSRPAPASPFLPDSRAGAFSTQSSLNPNYQQAKTLSDQGHFKKAIPLFDQACKAGVPQACSELGHMYEWAPHFTVADSVNQDYPRAMKLFTEACDAGNADGCYGIGFLYDQGFGVPQSFTRAAEYYSKACDWNNGVACNNLGVQLMNGAGVPQNKSKAQDVFLKGCAMGSDAACEWAKQLK
jgi:TPR repeat protein